MPRPVKLIHQQWWRRLSAEPSGSPAAHCEEDRRRVTYANLSATQITYLMPLQRLVNLRSLQLLGGTQISADQLQALRKALPQLLVVISPDR